MLTLEERKARRKGRLERKHKAERLQELAQLAAAEINFDLTRLQRIEAGIARKILIKSKRLRSLDRHLIHMQALEAEALLAKRENTLEWRWAEKQSTDILLEQLYGVEKWRHT